MFSLKWHRRYLRMAREASTWSKDPSTKVGAVTVDPATREVSPHYNGFPRNMPDLPEHYADRDQKLRRIIHAEQNATIGRRVVGHAMYVYPFFSCSRCSPQIIQSGISLVITTNDLPDRWIDDCNIAKQDFKDAEISYMILDTKILDTEDDDLDISSYLVDSYVTERMKWKLLVQTT